MNRSAHLALPLASLLALACGGEESSSSGGDDDTPEPVAPTEVSGETTETPTGETADPAEGPSYAIHEWGLLDVDLGDQQVEYAAGPGRAEEATAAATNTGSNAGSNTGSNGGSNGGGNNGVVRDEDVDTAVNAANNLLGAANEAAGGTLPIPTVGRRKPVLYFHLTDRATPVTFNLTVNLGTGRVVEHFPGGQLADHTVTWSGVQIGGSSCAGGPYPTADGPACAQVADGYCEAAELGGYVADDAGCLTVAGTEQNFLFYRGDGPAPALPVTIARSEDGTIRVTNDSMGEPVGPILRLRRGEGGAIQVAQVSTPAQGSSVAIGQPVDAASDQHRAIVREQLTEIGLTASEAEAFENAWFGELFDGEAPTPHAFSDAVLFFLPAESVDGFAHLEPSPAPAAIVRAMAVRAGWR